MCEFISWIQHKNAKGEPILLYLTDAEIFSSYGQEVLRGSAGNDFLGHGAIRAYFGKDGVPLQGGVEHEVRNFWNSRNLPKEIADKVANFPNHWGKTFRRYFQNDDLRYLIRYAPSEWQAKAAEQLLKQNQSNDDLYCIISYAPSEWRAKAAEQLLKQSLNNADLRYLTIYAPSEWQAKAVEQLLKQNPSNDDLCCIISCAPSEWRAKAQKMLDARH